MNSKNFDVSHAYIQEAHCHCGSKMKQEWTITRTAQEMSLVCGKRRWFNFWKHAKSGPHAYFPKPKSKETA